MIGDYLLKKTIDAAIEWAAQAFRETSAEISVSSADIVEAISHHMKYVEAWAREVSFRDILRPKATSDIFIPLNLYVKPRRTWLSENEQRRRLSLDDVFSGTMRHLVLLGIPGAGKTTSMKYIALRLLLDESFCQDSLGAPLVVRFRELNTDDNAFPDRNKVILPFSASPLIHRLFYTLGLSLSLDERLLGPDREIERQFLVEKSVVLFLDRLRALLILDGFDELRNDRRSTVAGEIEKLISHLQEAKVVITSRTGEFPYHLNNTDHFEICPLGEQQVVAFAQKWLGEEYAEAFLGEISKSPFSDTAIRPLTLSHLCAIYERTGSIPEKPRTAYRKIINLLLEEWDEQRSVQRTSKYAHFEIDRKFEFLCNLAYELTISTRNSVFRTSDLLRVYRSACANYDLAMQEARHVVNEIESHTGLILQTGYERFEFAHKSMQEYLSAEYIVRLPNIPTSVKVLQDLPHELAIAVTISSNPSNYLTELVLNRFAKSELSSAFYGVFLGRLLQEKPVFNGEPRVMLALASLYSYYLGSGSQLRFDEFYQDELIKEFEEFALMLRKRNDFSVLAQYYQIDPSPKDLGNIKAHVLRRVKRMEGYHLPNVLYARTDFLAV